MFVMSRKNSGNLSNFHMVIKQRLEDQYEQQGRNSKIIFVFYHCTKEKHFVSLEPVTTSYLLKSDVTQTHQELIGYVFFVITTHYVMNFILF